MNVTDILVDIVVVLLAAKIAAEIAERIGVPAVIGEIVAGIVVGPSVLGLLESNEVLEVLGELGVILLLLEVGLELSLGDLRSVGRASLAVAAIGVVVPVTLGFGTGLVFGESSNTALFLGSALAATSVGITARVFSDLGALTRQESRTVLGAAVADDVLGLVLLTVVVRVVTAGSVDVFDVLKIVGVALTFLVVAVALGTRYGPRAFQFVDRASRSAGTFVALALVFTLVFASLADAAELAPIVGAFAAGVALSGSAPAARVRRELTSVGHLFIPVFFLQIGVHAELDALADPGSLALIGALTVVAVIGKLAAGAGMRGVVGDRLLVGLGMLPRGEVGLIFASIGLANGVLDDSMYAALVSVVLLTTLAAPPCLRWRIRVVDARRPEQERVPMPEGGWLDVGQTVALAAEPPIEDALVVALDAAHIIGRVAPGNDLLDWLGRVELADAPWDRRATSRLLALLRDGSVRSWRFLEATGILERALPELADALRRRQADPFLLDPSNVHRFELVDALRDRVDGDAVAATVFERLRYPELPVLAALVLSVTGDGGDPANLAARIADRLRLGARAEEELVALARDAHLMHASIGRLDGLDEEPVLVLATHLGTPERVRALYLLSLATDSMEPWERDRLDTLLAHVLQALGQTDLTGMRAGNAVDARRRDALRHVGSPAAAERVLHAPRGYVLAHAPETIARHASLLDPAPRRGTLRVTTTGVDDASGRIEVVAFDRPGLLAAVTGVLAARGIDVVDAVAISWPDGAVVESYAVRSAASLDDAIGSPVELERSIVSALRSPGGTPAAPDLEVSFDEEASPWYTRCEVRGPDRVGLIHAVTVGFAATGVTVHSAHIETVDGVAVDRFELTDTVGRKLNAEMRRAVRDAIRSGSTAGKTVPRRRRLRGRAASTREA